MSEEFEIGLLVSNIVDENRYSHCRLCLEPILENQYARFFDTVINSENNKVLLFSILIKIFGEEITDEVPGIDAVCKNCLEKTLETYALIQQYELSTVRLHNVLDNLGLTLLTDFDTQPGQVMYLKCGEEASKLLLCAEEEKLVMKDTKLPILKVTHKCKNCKDQFEDINDLVVHNHDQHNLFMCGKCMCTSENETEVEEHALSTEFYKCDDCHRFYCTENSLAEHKNRKHCVHVCKDCGKTYKSLEKLHSHELKHVVKNECPKCGKTYTTKEFFERHVKLCLEDRVDPHPMRSRIEKTHICEICNKGYSNAGGLRVHKRFVHGNAEYHVCNECGKKFTAPCYLKAHKITHTKEKNFPCDLCPRKFVTKEALLYHRRRHTGEKPYSCDECGERFVNASARVDHIKFKHVGPTLTCEICSKKFVTKIILRNHMRKHNDPHNKLYVRRGDTNNCKDVEQCKDIAGNCNLSM